jgi:hypothetical protein
MDAEWKSLNDPALFPSDEVLASRLGRAMASLNAMREINKAELPAFEENWKFYNDYKSWLCKAATGKKTLFWMSAGERRFRATFYLGSGVGEAVLGSSLPEELKDQYRESAGKKYHGVTLIVKSKKDLAAYRELLAIKMSEGR